MKSSKKKKIQEYTSELKSPQKNSTNTHTHTHKIIQELVFDSREKDQPLEKKNKIRNVEKKPKTFIKN